MFNISGTHPKSPTPRSTIPPVHVFFAWQNHPAWPRWLARQRLVTSLGGVFSQILWLHWELLKIVASRHRVFDKKLDEKRTVFFLKRFKVLFEDLLFFGFFFLPKSWIVGKQYKIEHQTLKTRQI